MAALTDGQLAWLAGQKWGVFGAVPTQSALIAVSVALAESGGDADKHNTVPPDDSYGLWQINMRGDLGAERRARFHLTSNAQLLNPATNADVAHQLSGGGSDWSPWTTYRNGLYADYLDRARAGFAAQDDNIPGLTRVGWGPGAAADRTRAAAGRVIPDPLESVGAAAADAVEMVADAARWIGDRSNWARVAFVVLGGVVAALALAIVARPVVEDTAEKVTPL